MKSNRKRSLVYLNVAGLAVVLFLAFSIDLQAVSSFNQETAGYTFPFDEPATRKHKWKTLTDKELYDLNQQTFPVDAYTGSNVSLQELTAVLVQTIDTSEWDAASPDPAGIIYWPGENALLVSDPEVNETPLFIDKNLYQSSLTGLLQDSYTTTAFSVEPTGLALNLDNDHLFISDDDERSIFDFDPGSDGLLNTSDDQITSLDTSAFGNNDPEGVAYFNNRLYVIDGLDGDVYVISLGDNGIADGSAPDGDDVLVDQFDTTGFGISDPEGIDYHPDKGTLYLVGPNDRTKLLEVTTAGELVRVVDISILDAIAPSGIAIAPASKDPALLNLYITDRGVDNNHDPNENDGRIYEIHLQPPDPSFDDVPRDHWAYGFIEAIYAAGLTGGCSTDPLMYCPDANVTRAEMAVFLKKGIHGGSYSPPVPDGSHPFNDINGHWAEDWIEDLYDEGMTSGYKDGTYRPQNKVTRAEMAVFLLKAKHGTGYTPPSTEGEALAFSDIADHWGVDWIEQLADEDITDGYRDGTYRPDNPASRAEMAVFLTRTFELSLP